MQSSLLDNGTLLALLYSCLGSYIMSHSGLMYIRLHLGLAKKIKSKVFDYSLKKYPNAKVFGITTGLAVMKIKNRIQACSFSELTTEQVLEGMSNLY
jgi:hypothetical protein